MHVFTTPPPPSPLRPKERENERNFPRSLALFEKCEYCTLKLICTSCLDGQLGENLDTMNNLYVRGIMNSCACVGLPSSHQSHQSYLRPTSTIYPTVRPPHPLIPPHVIQQRQPPLPKAFIHFRPHTPPPPTAHHPIITTTPLKQPTHPPSQPSSSPSPTHPPPSPVPSQATASAPPPTYSSPENTPPTPQ